MHRKVYTFRRQRLIATVGLGLFLGITAPARANGYKYTPSTSPAPR
jgi:hypothetical protein